MPRGLACGLAMNRFFAGAAVAEQAAGEDYGGAALHENFAAIEPIDGSALQVRIGEQRVPEERDGPEVDGIVERFPKMTAKVDPKAGSHHENRDNIQGNGAERVFEWLLRRMHWIEDVAQPEMRGLNEKEDKRVRSSEEERDIPRPVVKPKIIEAAVRPVADGAIAEDHHSAEEHVDGDGADGDEAQIGAQVEEGHVHLLKRANIGFETAVPALAFHRLRAWVSPLDAVLRWCVSVGQFEATGEG